MPEHYDDENLNADAIYAALVWMRNYSETEEGQVAVRDLLDRNAEQIDSDRELVAEASGGCGNYTPIPTFEFCDDDLDTIYPDEPASVEFGIGLARFLIYGPPNGLAANFHPDPSTPIGVALSRFRADRAH